MFWKYLFGVPNLCTRSLTSGILMKPRVTDGVPGEVLHSYVHSDRVGSASSNHSYKILQEPMSVSVTVFQEKSYIPMYTAIGDGVPGEVLHSYVHSDRVGSASSNHSYKILQELMSVSVTVFQEKSYIPMYTAIGWKCHDGVPGEVLHSYVHSDRVGSASSNHSYKILQEPISVSVTVFQEKSYIPMYTAIGDGVPGEVLHSYVHSDRVGSASSNHSYKILQEPMSVSVTVFQEKSYIPMYTAIGDGVPGEVLHSYVHSDRVGCASCYDYRMGHSYVLQHGDHQVLVGLQPHPVILDPGGSKDGRYTG
ncbi:hypothetical protein J6590_037971 [Homalodisca vitripennis]|nr:hypothetical protein J6590_037971 [Homalodisca vitripennis]